MCVNKVYVKDVLRHGLYNVFDCGKCSACRQAVANRRASRIVNNTPNGYTCYMVTLTYNNKHIPYILKSDLIRLLDEASQDYIYSESDQVSDISIDVPVYRDYSVRVYKNGPNKLHRLSDPIDYRNITFTFKPEDVSNLPTLRTVLSYKNQIFRYDADKVSICYTADAQKFLKRLRTRIFRSFGTREKISYYYAPEYCPETARFHIHMLLWIPSVFTFDEVQYIIRSSWQFCNEDNLIIEVAKKAARYVAQYVNCSSRVPRFLQNSFRLRPSHSKDFGFTSDLFSLQEIYLAYKERRSFEYTYQTILRDGTVRSVTVPYPKYVINKYFPKFNGFSRLNITTLRHAYANPQKYFTLSTKPVRETPSGELVYSAKYLIDRYGNNLTFTKHYASYIIGAIRRAYKCFALAGIVCDIPNLIIDYHIARSSWLYKHSREELGPFAFYNLIQVYNGEIDHELFKDDFGDRIITPFDCNPNTYPADVERTKQLNRQFDDNIKQRKTNRINR